MVNTNSCHTSKMVQSKNRVNFQWGRVCLWWVTWDQKVQFQEPTKAVRIMTMLRLYLIFLHVYMKSSPIKCLWVVSLESVFMDKCLKYFLAQETMYLLLDGYDTESGVWDNQASIIFSVYSFADILNNYVSSISRKWRNAC